jgi:hypothetical protein
MLRIVKKLVLYAVAVALPCCCGGEQEDNISCTLYPPPNYGIVIHYLEGLEPCEIAAKISIDIRDMDHVEGVKIEGDDFLQRVQFHCADSVDSLVLGGNFCEFYKGGDNVDQEMSGKCALAFSNGEYAIAEFSCTLEPVEL